MIEARNLTKHFGDTVAVDDLSFDVRPGMVTGFLAERRRQDDDDEDDPRTRPSERRHGHRRRRRYRDLPAPLHEVGALLDAKAVTAGRRAYDHLLLPGPEQRHSRPGGSTRY